MEPGNLTQVSEFHLLGFSEDPQLQSLIFRLFLFMYLITVLETSLSSWLSAQTPPAHTHVLLPLQPVLCGHLLHLHHHPQDVVEHPDREQ